MKGKLLLAAAICSATLLSATAAVKIVDIAENVTTNLEAATFGSATVHIFAFEPV